MKGRDDARIFNAPCVGIPLSLAQQTSNASIHRLHLNDRTEKDNKKPDVTAAKGESRMEDREIRNSDFDSQSMKKQKKSYGGGYEQSTAVPSVLMSTFSLERENNDTSSRYESHHETAHRPHQQYETHHHEHHHHQPYRSTTEEYYAHDIPSSRSRSRSPPQPPPHRAQTYPYFQNQGRREDFYEAHNSHRRSRSHRFHRPYSPLAYRSAIEQHQAGVEQTASTTLPPPPISYVCESARTCYPSTTLGKKVRDEVRSMTEGTRLVPIARFARGEEFSVRGRMPESDRFHHYHRRRRQQQQQQQPQHDGSQSHRHPYRQIEEKTIRLLDSKKEILEVHSVLGRGTFSRITSVTIKEPKGKGLDNQLERPPPRFYACKSIKEEILVSNVARMGKRNREQSETYRQSVEFCVHAASQLAYEAHILSCLDHPNIVRMRGLDADGILGFEKRDHRGFFLLMDVLSQTLDQKLAKWRREQDLMSKTQHQHNDNPSSNREVVLLLRRQQEKLDISLQLASALQYLHDKRVVYRDLKPSNVGFIADGWTPETATNPPKSATRLQLFDFGLSRELTDEQPTLRGSIGTMRYMAPEVCLDAPYDCDCDIYSYSILCWELWTQKIPFQEVGTPDLYREQVCQRGHRPIYRHEEDPLYRYYSQQEQMYHQHHIHHRPVQTVPSEILLLLSQGWKQDPKARIRLPKITNQLILIATMVNLQLEERELSRSAQSEASNVGHAQQYIGQHPHPYNAPHRGRSKMEAFPNRFAQNQVHQYNEDHNRNNFEPIRIESTESFSLRDVDLDNVDLGI